MAESTISTQPVPQVARKPGIFSGRDRAIKIFLAATVIPMVLYMAFWSLFPILWGFTLSLFEYSARRAGAGGFLGMGGANPYIGLQHYVNMLDFSEEAPKIVKQFHQSLKTTVLFAFLVVPLNMSITLPLAVMLDSIHRRLQPFFRTFFFLPIVTASVGVAIMWGFIFHPQLGLLNGILTAISGKMVAIQWLGDPHLKFLGIPVALLAVIAAYLWQDIGYNTLIFIAALQSIPQSLRDAAKVDGVNSLQMFWHVTIPLLRPTILLAAVLTMISAFQVFDIIQVMTNGGPQDQTRVLVIDIYYNAFRFQRMGWASAVSVVLFLLVLVISLIQTRILRTEWEY